MKNKGYAISAIVYPLLLICFVLILSILQNLNNKQTLLDNLKSIIKNENNEMNSVCEYVVGTQWTFDYTGSPEEFTVPCNGTYKLETWGAQGGSINTEQYGGYGAYSTGSIKLQKDNNLFVTVGGSGSYRVNNTDDIRLDGGYNGGGNGRGMWSDSPGFIQHNTSGGGATHIATTNRGILYDYKDYRDEIVMVAAGGGGAMYMYYDDSIYAYSIGGHAGGIEGSKYTSTYNKNTFDQYLCGSTNANQEQASSHCYNGIITTSIFGFGAEHAAGGGGGYYGGSGSGFGGLGGSSYINNPQLFNKTMHCYNCKESAVEETKTITTTNVSSTPVSEYAKMGNGYAKITLVSIDNSTPVDNEPVVEIEVSLNRADFNITDDIGIVAFGVSKSDTEAPQYTSIESTLSTTQTWNTTEKGTYYVWVKDTGGNITIKAFKILNVCAYEVGQTWTFDYSGNSEEFTIPCSGAYKLEVWGAQGGSINLSDNTTYNGGYGAYSTGSVNLQKDNNLYVVVGGAGTSQINHASETQITYGGYNGGANAVGRYTGSTTAVQYNASGGGVTHIGTFNDTLADHGSTDGLYIVAGGGGGSAYFYVSSSSYSFSNGGHAGGIEGSKFELISGTTQSWICGNANATQSSGGKTCYYNTWYGPSTFGKGSVANAGGGGGLYGGAGGQIGGNGGSSYINNSELYNKVMYCYNCKESDVEGTKTITTTNVSSSPISEYAKKGNGYAKITLVSID